MRVCGVRGVISSQRCSGKYALKMRFGICFEMRAMEDEYEVCYRIVGMNHIVIDCYPQNMINDNHIMFSIRIEITWIWPG